MLLISMLLGIVQGITEFLPISSSAHLVVIKKLSYLQSAGAGLETLLHIGTLVAVIFFYRRNWFDIFRDIIHPRKNSTNLRFFGLLLLASVPAGVLGLIFKDAFESAFESVGLVAFNLFVTSAILLSTILTKPKENFRWNVVNALAVGVAQAVTILPGVSRSGVTIAVGLWLGAPPEDSAKFSFMLAVPAMLGAILLEIDNIVSIGSLYWEYLVGLITAIIFGFIALVLLVPVMGKKKLWFFGIYCALFASLILLKF